jgi:hypothetical protein
MTLLEVCQSVVSDRISRVVRPAPGYPGTYEMRTVDHRDAHDSGSGTTTPRATTRWSGDIIDPLTASTIIQAAFESAIQGAGTARAVTDGMAAQYGAPEHGEAHDN